MEANPTKKASTFASVAMLLVVLWGVPLLPEAYAGRSEELVAPTPALVFSKIDGNFTDIRQLKLTPLGKQLASEDGSWMPAHEWEDALAQPQALYLADSLEEGGPFVRLKYYEKGWIACPDAGPATPFYCSDTDRWLDILIDDVRTPTLAWNPGYFTDSVEVWFNPGNDYDEDTRGDYLFSMWHMSVSRCSDQLGVCQKNFSYWRGPFTRYNWHDTPEYIGVAAFDVGRSPDFPALPQHVVWEMRVNLDALGVANRFGLVVWVSHPVIESGNPNPVYWVGAAWPREVASNGLKEVSGIGGVIPTYWGVAELSSDVVIAVRTTTITVTTERTSTTTAVSTVETERTDLTALALAVAVSVGVGFAVGHLVGRRRIS